MNLIMDKEQKPKRITKRISMERIFDDDIEEENNPQEVSK